MFNALDRPLPRWNLAEGSRVPLPPTKRVNLGSSRELDGPGPTSGTDRPRMTKKHNTRYVWNMSALFWDDDVDLDYTRTWRKGWLVFVCRNIITGNGIPKALQARARIEGRPDKWKALGQRCTAAALHILSFLCHKYEVNPTQLFGRPSVEYIINTWKLVGVNRSQHESIMYSQGNAVELAVERRGWTSEMTNFLGVSLPHGAYIRIIVARVREDSASHRSVKWQTLPTGVPEQLPLVDSDGNPILSTVKLIPYLGDRPWTPAEHLCTFVPDGDGVDLMVQSVAIDVGTVDIGAEQEVSPDEKRLRKRDVYGNPASLPLSGVATSALLASSTQSIDIFNQMS